MASKTPHKRELGKVNLGIGEGITGWVAQENKPVAIGKRAYQDTRQGIVGSIVAGALGFEPRPLLEIGT